MVRGLLVAAALASALRAQTPPDFSSSALSLAPARVWEIPALGYGLNLWSILRFNNNADVAASVQVDVYCQGGARMPLPPVFAVPARDSLDIRIEAPSKVLVGCWARVQQVSGARGPEFELRAFVESLKGNQLEDFDRPPGLATANSAWAFSAAQIAGEQLYILNASDTPTMLTFCSASKPDPKACEKKGAKVVRRLAKPKEAVQLDVLNFPRKYLIAESSRPGRAIIEVFNDKPGHRRVFASESSIFLPGPRQLARSNDLSTG
jgi:hypothetical protein